MIPRARTRSNWPATTCLVPCSHGCPLTVDAPEQDRIDSGVSVWYGTLMTVADIRLMTVPDKIRLMEALWQDLSGGDEVVQSPGWHADVLAERVSRAESGQDTFIDWDAAKKLLREELL